MKNILPIALILIGLIGMLAAPTHSAVSVIIIAVSLGCLGSGIILIIANLKYRQKTVHKPLKTQSKE